MVMNLISSGSSNEALYDVMP